MGEIKEQPLPVRGSARRALIITAGFACFYTLWDVLSVYYFPSFLNAGRRPMIERLVLFLLCGGAAALCLLLTRKDGSAPPPLLREMTAFRRDPVLWIVAVWFLWACAATVPAVREGFATYTHNSSYLFDQFVNCLILFPLGYLLARRRDDRLLTVTAAGCFLLFLPFALGALALSVTHESLSLLGRVIELDWANRLRLGGNPNTGGIYGALAFSAGLYLFEGTRRRGLRVLLAAGEGIVFFALLLTKSRGGIGSAAVGLIFYLLVLLSRKAPSASGPKNGMVWKIVGGVALFALLIGLAPMLQRITGRKLETTNPTERVAIWDYVIHTIMGDSHFLLHGVSSAAVDSKVGWHFGRPLYSSHNQLLEVWFGQGTPALVLFLAFLVLVALRCLKVSFSHRGGEHTGNWAASLFVLTLFLNSMVEVILVNSMTAQGSVFFLASGAVCGMASLLPRGKKGAEKK